MCACLEVAPKAVAVPAERAVHIKVGQFQSVDCDDLIFLPIAILNVSRPFSMTWKGPS